MLPNYLVKSKKSFSTILGIRRCNWRSSPRIKIGFIFNQWENMAPLWLPYEPSNYLVYEDMAIYALAISHACTHPTCSRFIALNVVWWIMLLISGENNLKRMSTRKMDTLNNSCYVACVKFKLPCDKTIGCLRTIHFLREAVQLRSDAWIPRFTRYIYTDDILPARVLDVVVCLFVRPSVCLSVYHKSVFYWNV